MSSDAQARSLLDLARELQHRDDAAAAEIDVIAGLIREADRVRDRAAAVLEELSLLPGELARNDEAEREAGRRVEAAGRELAEAETRAEEAARARRGGEEARAQAHRELTRAREQLADARTAMRRLTERRQELVDTERALRAEADGLAVVARGIADEIRDTPRVSESGRKLPGPGLTGLVEWGARVHAALFVVRGGLESERDRIVVEASTLAASVLGEQAAGTNVALVRRRLELHLRSG